MQPVGMERQRGNSGAELELSQRPCCQENSLETLWGGEIGLMTLCEGLGEHHLQVGKQRRNLRIGVPGVSLGLESKHCLKMQRCPCLRTGVINGSIPVSMKTFPAVAYLVPCCSSCHLRYQVPLGSHTPTSSERNPVYLNSFISRLAMLSLNCIKLKC